MFAQEAVVCMHLFVCFSTKLWDRTAGLTTSGQPWNLGEKPSSKAYAYVIPVRYSEATLDRSFTYHWYLESLRKTLTSRVALLRRLAGSRWGAVVTTLRAATLALVHSTAEYSCLVSQCSNLPRWFCHQRRFVNRGWMPASYTSGQPTHPRRHPTCWASSQRSPTVSRTPCHGAWTSAPLSAHLCTEWEYTASQIETPICTCCTTTHQFIWRQQQKYGDLGGSPMKCGVVGQHYETRSCHPRHWPSAPTLLE